MKEISAAISLGLGGLSLWAVIFAVFLGFNSGFGLAFIPFAIFALLSSILGIVLGIIGLKSSKRLTALGGIVVCVLCLIIFFVAYYISARYLKVA